MTVVGTAATAVGAAHAGATRAGPGFEDCLAGFKFALTRSGPCCPQGTVWPDAWAWAGPGFHGGREAGPPTPARYYCRMQPPLLP